MTKPETPCQLWPGSISGGYGKTRFNGKPVLAHRLAWFQAKGVWPIGPLDHTCHNNDPGCVGGKTCLHRRCVNVEHLEEVTIKENTLRSRHTLPAQNASKTHCPKGHPYSGNNLRTTRGWRECRACDREWKRLHYTPKRSANVRIINNVVAIKHSSSFVPSDFHGNSLGNTGINQVADSRAA